MEIEIENETIEKELYKNFRKEFELSVKSNIPEGNDLQKLYYKLINITMDPNYNFQKEFGIGFMIKKKIVLNLLNNLLNLNDIVYDKEFVQILNTQEDKIIFNQKNKEWFDIMNKDKKLLDKEYNENFLQFDIIIKNLNEIIFLSGNNNTLLISTQIKEYYELIINFLPCLPNIIFIFYNPIFWSSIIYNLIFCKFLKNEKINFEFIDKIPLNKQESFLKLNTGFGNTNNSLLLKIFQIRNENLEYFKINIEKEKEQYYNNLFKLLRESRREVLIERSDFVSNFIRPKIFTVLKKNFIDEKEILKLVELEFLYSFQTIISKKRFFIKNIILNRYHLEKKFNKEYMNTIIKNYHEYQFKEFSGNEAYIMNIMKDVNSGVKISDENIKILKVFYKQYTLIEIDKKINTFLTEKCKISDFDLRKKKEHNNHIQRTLEEYIDLLDLEKYERIRKDLSENLIKEELTIEQINQEQEKIDLKLKIIPDNIRHIINEYFQEKYINEIDQIIKNLIYNDFKFIFNNIIIIPDEYIENQQTYELYCPNKNIDKSIFYDDVKKILETQNPKVNYIFKDKIIDELNRIKIKIIEIQDLQKDKEYQLNGINSLIFPNNVMVIQSEKKNKPNGISIFISKDSFIHNLFKNNFYNIKKTIRIKLIFHNEIKEKIIDFDEYNDLEILSIFKSSTRHKKELKIITESKTQPLNDYIHKRLFTDYLNININDFEKFLKQFKDLLVKRDYLKSINNLYSESFNNHYSIINREIDVNSIDIQHIYTFNKYNFILNSTLKHDFFIKLRYEKRESINEKTSTYNFKEIKLIDGKKIDLSKIIIQNMNKLNIQIYDDDNAQMEIENNPPQFYQEDEIDNNTLFPLLPLNVKLIPKYNIMKPKYNPQLYLINYDEIAKNQNVNFIAEFNRRIYNSLDKKLYLTFNCINIIPTYEPLNDKISVNSNYFRYFIKLQSNVLQYLTNQYKNNKYFKDKNNVDMTFQFTFKNNNKDITYQTDEIKIQNLYGKKLDKIYRENKIKNKNIHYNENSYANIFITNTSLGKITLGLRNLKSLFSINSVGNQLSRGYSNHFERFFEFQNMYYIFQDKIFEKESFFQTFFYKECKEYENIKTYKPYNILIINPLSKNQIKQMKEDKTKTNEKNKDIECKYNNLYYLNYVNSFEGKTDEEKKNILLQKKHLEEDYHLIIQKFKKDWESNYSSKLNNIFFNENYYNKNKDAYPIYYKYLSFYFPDLTSNISKIGYYSHVNYLLTKYFDYYYLQTICSKVELKITIYDGINSSNNKTYNLEYEKDNLIFELPDKGTDPFLTSYLFYDIEDYLIDPLLYPQNFNEILSESEIDDYLYQRKSLENLKLRTFKNEKLNELSKEIYHKDYLIKKLEKEDKEKHKIEIEKLNNDKNFLFNEYNNLKKQYYKDINLKHLSNDKIIRILIDLKQFLLKLFQKINESSFNKIRTITEVLNSLGLNKLNYKNIVIKNLKQNYNEIYFFYTENMQEYIQQLTNQEDFVYFEIKD